MKTAVALVITILLSGCALQQENTDPRKGVVYLEEDACSGLKIGSLKTFGCTGDTKVCVGPDLRFESHYGDDSKVIKDSPECKP